MRIALGAESERVLRVSGAEVLFVECATHMHILFFLPAKSVKGVFSPNTRFLRMCQARPIRAHTCPGISSGDCAAGWAQAWRKI